MFDAWTATEALPLPPPLPDTDAASSAFYRHADNVLLKTVPTTSRGCTALAHYAVEFSVKNEWQIDEDQNGTAHLRVLDLIARSPVADPVVAADADEPFNVERVAAIDFNAYTLDQPARGPQDWTAEFAERALAFSFADRLLRMDKADMVAFIRDAGESDAGAPVALLNTIGAAQETFEGWGKLLNVVQARYMAAAASAIEAESR